MPKIDDAAAELAETNEVLIKAKNDLEQFEKGIRKHGYSVLLKASNSQKMNLEFEHLIAQDAENWRHWLKLTEDVAKAEAKFFESKIWYEVALERLRGNVG